MCFVFLYIFYSNILCSDSELIKMHAGLNVEDLILSTFNQKQNVLTYFTQTPQHIIS